VLGCGDGGGPPSAPDPADAVDARAPIADAADTRALVGDGLAPTLDQALDLPEPAVDATADVPLVVPEIDGAATDQGGVGTTDALLRRPSPPCAVAPSRPASPTWSRIACPPAP
jgi:hypothetical protein